MCMMAAAPIIVLFTVFSCLAAETINEAECQESAEVEQSVCVCVCFLQQGARLTSNNSLQTDTFQALASGPWDQYTYLVGAHHKAGSDLLRKIMHLAFDALGANQSCSEQMGQFPHAELALKSWYPDGVLTTIGGQYSCDDPPHLDCPIRYKFNLEGFDFAADRPGTTNKELRAVHMIRDPLEMIASAYCYHHGGAESWSELYAPANITSLSAAEGVPLVAQRMYSVTASMVATSLASGKNAHLIRYENITRSSIDFDLVIADAFYFLFGGLINDSSMQLIQELATKQDLNRGIKVLDQQHVSDDDCKAAATEALPLIQEDLLLLFHKQRQVLGYA